ncbi:MAG: glycosyltransferase [Actinobacteria bacterium]|nr:glycosyltransferase [Actinomycetota bacterium]
MYGIVYMSRKSLEEQLPYAGEEVAETIRSLAAPLRGVRVLNLSLSPFGTGVAETLHSLVPLLRDLGIQSEWQVVHSDTEFAHTVRLMYQGLCGKGIGWTSEIVDSWQSYSRFGATFFDDSYDVVVIHDPQLAGILEVLSDRGLSARGGRWVWHCHLDLRWAQPEVWETLLHALSRYDAWVSQNVEFVPAAPQPVLSAVIPPAIDPTNAVNIDMNPANIRQFCGNLDIDPQRPLVVQVGPLDPSFDPVGAIDVYRRAKAERPDLQLLLAHPLAENSLEAWSRFEQVARHVEGDAHIRVLATQSDAGRLTINAAQRAASVVLQRSVPAGFALSVWEAQWKEKPVVVGWSGALPSQIEDGRTGRLAVDDDSFVEAILDLIADPAAAGKLGMAGREVVQKDYLITRLLAEELRLLSRLLAGSSWTSRPWRSWNSAW